MSGTGKQHYYKQQAGQLESLPTLPPARLLPPAAALPRPPPLASPAPLPATAATAAASAAAASAAAATPLAALRQRRQHFIWSSGQGKALLLLDAALQLLQDSDLAQLLGAQPVPQDAGWLADARGAHPDDLQGME